jgi:hypothetical protein
MALLYRSRKNYFFFSSFFASAAGAAVLAAESAGLAGAAVIVSAGGGVAGGAATGVAVASLAAESALALAASPPLPQEATKRPSVRATIDNFANFILMFFSWLCTFILVSEKGNPVLQKKLKYFLFLRVLN